MNSRHNPGKVSVIMPTYNRAPFIGNAVRSIERQDYENMEIIVVDDGSTDETLSVVTLLQEANPRIRFLLNGRTKGPSGARNTGLLASSGDYIAFLDSDDIWLEGHLKKGTAILDSHPEVDVLFGNFTVTDYRTGEPLFNFFDRKDVFRTLKTAAIGSDAKIIEDDLFRALIRENFFHLGSSLHRKTALEGILFDENVTYAEDRDLAIALYMDKKARFAFREEPVFVLYRHDSSLTHYDDVEKRRKLLEAHLFLFSKYSRTYFLAAPEKTLLSKLISEHLLGLANVYGEEKKYGLMLQSTIDSCKHRLCLGQPRALLKLLYLTLLLK